MKIALALLLALAASAVQADQLIVHFASWHADKGFCDANPGLGWVRASGLTFGAYRNSECKVSLYLGQTWEKELTSNLSATLTLGGVTGYAAFPVMPLVLPALSYRITGGTSLALGFLPKVHKSQATSAVHLFLKQEF